MTLKRRARKLKINIGMPKFMTNLVSSSNIDIDGCEVERVEAYIYFGHEVRISEIIRNEKKTYSHKANLRKNISTYFRYSGWGDAKKDEEFDVGCEESHNEWRSTKENWHRRCYHRFGKVEMEMGRSCCTDEELTVGKAIAGEHDQTWEVWDDRLLAGRTT